MKFTDLLFQFASGRVGVPGPRGFGEIAVFNLGGLFNLKLPDGATEADDLGFVPTDPEGAPLSEGRAPDFEGSGNAATLTTRRIGFSR